MVKVKICGITNITDALASTKAGCDALGFVFYKKSPRYISPVKARSIIARVPRGVITIGVFVNAKEKTVKRILKACKLSMMQFHGDESPAFCERFAKYKVIKAFRIKKSLDLERISRYHTFAYLFDTFTKAKIGGTGKKFDWKLLSELDTIAQPVFLSGGLTAANVRAAVRGVQPAWVDVSSSVEIKPGKKDHTQVKKFVHAVKSA